MAKLRQQHDHNSSMDRILYCRTKAHKKEFFNVAQRSDQKNLNRSKRTRSRASQSSIQAVTKFNNLRKTLCDRKIRTHFTKSIRSTRTN